jgi:type VI secretion system protein ImpK
MGIQEAVPPGAGGDDLASSQFRAFAAVLVRARSDAVTVSEADGRARAAALSHELCQLIDLQSLEAGRVGGRAGVDTHLQARYLKAALADELMLHTDWAGRAHWHHVLIEATLFQTAHAGQQVFADIDALLRERDPVRRPVARLYLLLLAFGFQGRWRGKASLVQIADYRRDLYQFAWQRVPGQGGRDAVLSGQPYASTLAGGAGQRLAKPSRRSAVLVLALLAVLGLSELLWLWQSWPVRQALAAPFPALAGPRGPA